MRFFPRFAFATLFIVLNGLSIAAQPSGDQKLYDEILSHIDTRIGTREWQKKSTLSNAELPKGHVYPGVGMPFAMTQWAAQTNTGDIPYFWQDGKCQGFRATHYPNGASMSEYGSFCIMPSTGNVETDAAKRASAFSHNKEVAKPHYYAVDLERYNVRAEMTGTNKAGYLKFTYPKADKANILIDNPRSNEENYYRVIPERNEVEGFTTRAGRVGNQGYTGREFACYFVARFSKPFNTYAVVSSPRCVPLELLFEEGFKGEFFNNTDLSGTPVVTSRESGINFNWPNEPAKGVKADKFSARFTGKMKARQSGVHTFTVKSNDGARLFINGTKVLDQWFDHGSMTTKYEMSLTQGEEYSVVLEYYDSVAEGELQLSCTEPANNDLQECVKRALKGGFARALTLHFGTAAGESIEVKVGTSFINFEQARQNLNNEIGDRSFSDVMNSTKQAWGEALSKIEIDASDYDKDIFYTALQRCLLLPRNITEGEYHYSAFNGKVMPGTMYTDFSLWDTFRSLHPLLILIQPDRVSRMIEALLNSYDEGGWIPKWPSPGYSNIMHGTHGDAVIADAYIKGIRNFDHQKALEAMMKNATTKGSGEYAARVGVTDYNKLGFVPTDKYGESAIRTLEFSYDNFCIAQMAKAMNRNDIYTQMLRSSMNYINMLDPETKLVRGRNSDGTWRSATDPSISGWAAGNDRDRENYFRNITLFVPHDVQGLANFMGGNKQLETYLDHFFQNDFYYVGDEYSMHSPYMYNFIGKAWKTQKVIRELLDYNFTNDSSGLPGNEDCGQMSSWYIMGAMGFYPVCPGVPAYQIGSPVVNKLTLKLSNGNTFKLIAENNSKENVYIQSATLNGKKYTQSWISHNDIMQGGTLVLKMGNKPNKKWGSQQADILPSLSQPAP